MKRLLHAMACTAMFCVLALELQAAATMRTTPMPPINGQRAAAIVPAGDGIAATERQARQGNGGEPCIQQARAMYIAATEAGARDACAKRFINKVPMFNAPPRYDQVVLRA